MSINNLQPSTITYSVIRGWIKIANNKYEWRFAYVDQYDHSFEWEEHYSANHNINDMPLQDREDLILSIEELLDYDPVQFCELIQITETKVFEKESFGSERITELRRNRALSKLTSAEIKLLGLEKFAVYDKLKFHNVDEDDDG